MKKLITILILFVSINSQASHLMGGDIRIEFDSIQNTYLLKVTHYRDTYGVPAYTSLQCTFTQFDLTGTNFLTNNSTTLLPDYNAGFGTPMFGIPYPVEVYNYSCPIGYMFNALGSGKFTFYVTECCRNYAILNMATPGSESLNLSCEYKYDSTSIGVNDNPQCLAEPIIFGPVNQLWSYNPFPYDADGDSLVWALRTPLSAMIAPGYADTCIGYTLPPSTVANPFSINPSTGEITWEPNLAGHYVASFSIDEYRNGVKIGNTIRDMQYIVLPDTSTGGPGGGNKLPQFSNVTNYSTNIQNIKYINYYPGQAFEFKIKGQDANLSQTLTMNAISNLISIDSVATFGVTNTGTNNEILGTFNWTPQLTDTKDFMVVFRLKDGSFTNDLTLVLQKANHALSVTNNVNYAQCAVYPNPSSNGKAIVALPNNSNEMQAITITDVQGKVISTKNIQAASGKLIIDVPTTKGLYMLQIESDGVTTQRAKIMVK